MSCNISSAVKEQLDKSLDAFVQSDYDSANTVQQFLSTAVDHKLDVAQLTMYMQSYLNEHMEMMKCTQTYMCEYTMSGKKLYQEFEQYSSGRVWYAQVLVDLIRIDDLASLILQYLYQAQQYRFEFAYLQFKSESKHDQVQWNNNVCRRYRLACNGSPNGPHDRAESSITCSLLPGRYRVSFSMALALPAWQGLVDPLLPEAQWINQSTRSLPWYQRLLGKLWSKKEVKGVHASKQGLPQDLPQMTASLHCLRHAGVLLVQNCVLDASVVCRVNTEHELWVVPNESELAFSVGIQFEFQERYRAWIDAIRVSEARIEIQQIDVFRSEDYGKMFPLLMDEMD